MAHPSKKQKAKARAAATAVYLCREQYELQVLDNYNNRTYSNGQAGSFYKQKIPLVTACKKPRRMANL